jgi:hypothetical protein
MHAQKCLGYLPQILAIILKTLEDGIRKTRKFPKKSKFRSNIQIFWFLATPKKQYPLKQLNYEREYKRLDVYAVN